MTIELDRAQCETSLIMSYPIVGSVSSPFQPLITATGQVRSRPHPTRPSGGHVKLLHVTIKRRQHIFSSKAAIKSLNYTWQVQGSIMQRSAEEKCILPFINFHNWCGQEECEVLSAMRGGMRGWKVQGEGGGWIWSRIFTASQYRAPPLETCYIYIFHYFEYRIWVREQSGRRTLATCDLPEYLPSRHLLHPPSLFILQLAPFTEKVYLLLSMLT